MCINICIYIYIYIYIIYIYIYIYIYIFVCVCIYIYILDPLLLIRNSSPCSGSYRFPGTGLLSGPKPHTRFHITVNKMC